MVLAHVPRNVHTDLVGRQTAGVDFHFHVLSLKSILLVGVDVSFRKNLLCSSSKLWEMCRVPYHEANHAKCVCQSDVSLILLSQGLIGVLVRAPCEFISQVNPTADRC